MTKRNKRKILQPVKKPNIFIRIFRFFFPKDFAQQVKIGMLKGQEMSISKKMLDGAYGSGKLARKFINPRKKK